MFDRKRDQASTRIGAGERAFRRSRPRLEALEDRALMAVLAPPPSVNVPTGLGYQLALDGGSGDNQTYTVASDNPLVKATIAQGKFLTIGVKHDSSGANDPAFSGSMTFQLFDDLTPITTSKIEELVNQGFYMAPTTGSPSLSSKNFHRVANNFPGPNNYIVQGGSQSGNGSGSLNAPGFPFVDEFVQQLAFTGFNQLAMANAGDDTNDSQFFITTGSPRFLDFNHTIFGQLVSGQQVLAQMTQVAKSTTDGTTPVNPIQFTSATLSAVNPDGVIHIDATQAPAGTTANLTVTATDPTTNTSVTRTLQAFVLPNVDSTGAPIVERPFLTPAQAPNQTVGQVTTTSSTGSTTTVDQIDVFKIGAVAPTAGDPLTFKVQGFTKTGNTITPSTLQNATANVDSNNLVTDPNGIARITPTQGFTGVINVLIGVRDKTDRSTSGGGINDPTNFDTNAFTLTVVNGQPINLQPIATGASNQLAQFNRPTTFQLPAETANPQSTTQTLSYTLLSNPQHGTISGFNPSTGTFVYTPNPNYIGPDSLQYRVTDQGAPTPSLTSPAATFNIVVTGDSFADATVKVVDRVLVVTPAPRVDGGTNTIALDLVSGQVATIINGFVSDTHPNVSDLDRIVVYGGTANDNINLSPDITLPATLDGGHGGVNVLKAGDGITREHGWFGKNTLIGGPAKDALIGRTGHVFFKKSAGKDLLFTGNGRPGRKLGGLSYPSNTFNIRPKPPTGTFYKFVGKRLVKIPTPKAVVTHDGTGGSTGQ